MGITLLYVLFIVVGLRFFPPAQIGAVLFFIAICWLVYDLVRNSDLRSLAVPVFAAVIGAVVWYADSAQLFKALPALISALFFVKFTDAVIRKKPFLAAMVKKTPKIEWTQKKLAYIDSSHGYWAVVSGINTAIQIAMLFAPMSVWALYTTVGWYLFFGTALASQIIYGKMQGV